MSGAGKDHGEEDEAQLPGFRFHPTDEELLGYYLRRKVENKPIKLELIKQIDIYKFDPWDLPSRRWTVWGRTSGSSGWTTSGNSRNETLEYMNKSKKMVRKLLEYLGKNLNIKELDETKESLFMGSIRINLNYYSICPNPDLTVGVGRHSDVSSLTIRLQDQIGGLHVRSLTSGSWVHVPPVPGSFVINIEDAMQILSNGRYKSIEHRVLANGNNNRISVPIFVNPKPDSLIGPLPEVTANREEPIYRDIVYSDYVMYFFRKAHDGKKTVDYAKI